MIPLCISFSGGRSSAVMTKLCIDEWRGKRPIVVVFANTGWEHPATLDFVDECDRHWGLKVVWLESVSSPDDGVGVTFKIVDYQTASRSGEPFESYIAKYGIPNKVCPGCSEKLKAIPIEKYCRSFGWDKWETAIGIRADEIDRMSVKAQERRLIYPLIDKGFTKSMVNTFMRNQPFDLQIPGDHLGNCEGCYKKSDRKLLTVAKERPEAFDFPLKMEQKYANYKSRADGYQAGADDGRRYFYRGHRSAQWYIDHASDKFVPYRDQIQGSIFDLFLDVKDGEDLSPFFDDLDIGGACDQGCEIYGEDVA